MRGEGKIGYARKGHPEKISVGWYYAGACCPYCLRPDLWFDRGGSQKNHKSKTLRTHRTGLTGKNCRNRKIPVIGVGHTQQIQENCDA